MDHKDSHPQAVKYSHSHRNLGYKRLQETFKLKSEKIRLAKRDGQDHLPFEKQNQSKPQSSAALSKNEFPAAYPRSRIPVRKVQVEESVSLHEKFPMGRKDKRVRFEEALGYAWDKKGRLNELKIRYLARKYVTLWRRIVASIQWKQTLKALRHHRRKVLFGSFDAWKDYWWTQRKEWTLIIRAGYHHRYHIYLKVWKMWQAFVIRQKVKKAKLAAANMNANRSLLQKTFTVWRDWLSTARAKRRRKAAADRFAEMRTMERSFKTWKARIEHSQAQQEMELMALQFWADQLYKKVLMAWKRYLFLQKEEKVKNTRAEQLYERNLLQQCFFKGWVSYVLHRRERHSLKGIADEHCISSILREAFCHWKTRHIQQRCMTLKWEQISDLGQRSRLRRIIQHWKYYVTLCYEDRQNMLMACLHYERHLKIVTLSSLQLAVVQREVKMERNEEAHMHYQHSLIRNAWNCWMVQWERREEVQLSYKSTQARTLYKLKVQKKCFGGWMRYLKWRQQRKQLYTNADAFFLSRLMPKCFYAMVDYVRVQKDEREEKRKALEYRRERVLSFYWNVWIDAYHFSQDLRTMERMAILQEEENNLRRHFNEWRHRTQLRLQAQDCMEVASEHYDSSLCQKCFQAWKKFVHEELESKVHDMKAIKYDYMKTLRKQWNEWRKFVVYRRNKKMQRSRAEHHRATQLEEKIMIAWKKYHENLKQIYCIVETKYAVKERDRLRLVLRQWHSNAIEAAHYHALQLRAEHHRQRVVLRQALLSWQNYATDRSVKRATNTLLVAHAQIQLNQGKLRHAFQYWCRHAKYTADMRRKSALAVNHWKVNVLAEALRQWKQFRKVQMKKLLLDRQCRWLHTTRMQAKYFLRWKIEYHAVLENNAKTTMALWHWSLTLQLKALDAWHQYILDRRKTKLRYEKAMDWRQQELLSEGISQWLLTADTLAERRTRQAMMQQTEVTRRSFEVVHRFAIRWRQKTIQNRNKPRASSVLTAHSQFKRLPPISKVLDAPVFSLRHPQAADTAGELNAQNIPFLGSHPSRPKPRHPDFLRDSLQKAGLWWDSPQKDTPKSEIPPEFMVSTEDQSEMNAADFDLSQPPSKVFHPPDDGIDNPGPINDQPKSNPTSPLLLIGKQKVRNNETFSKEEVNIQSTDTNRFNNVRILHPKPPSGKPLLTPAAFMKPVSGSRPIRAQHEYSSGKLSPLLSVERFESQRSKPFTSYTEENLYHKPVEMSMNVAQSVPGTENELSHKYELSHEYELFHEYANHTFQKIDRREGETIADVCFTEEKEGVIPVWGDTGRCEDETTGWIVKMKDGTEKCIEAGGGSQSDGVYDDITVGALLCLKEHLVEYQKAKDEMRLLESQKLDLEGWLNDGSLADAQDSARLLIQEEIDVVLQEMNSKNKWLSSEKKTIVSMLSKLEQLPESASE